MGTVAAEVGIEVDGVDAEGRIRVHQGARTGVFVPRPSGDDLYLYWVETTPAPARDPGWPPCVDWAVAVQTDPGVCAGPAPDGALSDAVTLRQRRGGWTAELRGYGRRTEQWVWSPVPAHRSASPPNGDLSGWTWDAAGWGVGVPLFVPSPAPGAAPMIIGHRGSPGRLPDHTLEGYLLAVVQGADAIEPDLVITADGVLVARHENELSHTTDVAAKFPDRKRTAVIDGATVEGWFAEDFTLAELKTLRAVQPWPERPHDHDGAYLVPTFDEVLELAERAGEARGRPVAVIPETKHPTYFRALGLPLEPPMAAAIARHPGLELVIQSFELENLAALTGNARRVWLVGEPDAPIPGDTRTYGEVLADLPALRERVEAVGVAREVVWGDAGPTGFVERAHRAGLQVFVWTFRVERPGPAGGGDPVAEIEAFLRLGVDGVFTDQPDVGRAAADRLTPR